MKQSRPTVRLVSLAVLTVLTEAAVGCARQDEPVSTTTVTSTTVPVAATAAAAAHDDPSGALVCEEPALAVASPSPAAVTAKSVATSVKEAPPRARGRGSDLDEAIAASVHSEADTTLGEAIKASVKQDATEPQAAAPPPVVASAMALPAMGLAAQDGSELAPARVTFENRLPSSYELQRVRMLVDGATSYDAPRAGSIQVAPGGHLVQVIADYRLQDPVFTYVDAYRVEVQQMQYVSASRTPLDFVATAAPTGGVTTPVQKRAMLEWESLASR